MSKKIIHICNICEKETENNEEMKSKFLYTERRFFGNKGAQSREEIKEYDFCMDCTDKIKRLIVKEKAECQRNIK